MEPTVGADEAGLWREDRPGARMVLPWKEITRISGAKLDCIRRVDTLLEVDHESGHFMEFYDSWPGFSDVVQAITYQFPDLPPDWFEEVSKLNCREPSLIVWQRADYPG